MPEREVEHDQEQDQEQEHDLDNESGEDALSYPHSQVPLHEERGGDVSPVRRIAWYVQAPWYALLVVMGRMFVSLWINSKFLDNLNCRLLSTQVLQVPAAVPLGSVHTERATLPTSSLHV